MLAGVTLGLVVGKTVGVFGGAWLAVRVGVGRLPTSATWRHMVGLAVTAGIGFTVALFVTGLSFTDPALTSSAKIGILLASAVAGLLGFVLLRTLPAVPTAVTDPRHPRTRQPGRGHTPSVSRRGRAAGSRSRAPSRSVASGGRCRACAAAA